MDGQLENDLDFVKAVLPEHYEIQESKTPGSIHCRSLIGIRKPPYPGKKSNRIIDDAEDEILWGKIFKTFKGYFSDRFQEVYHNTCFCHVDFTIYIKRA